MLSSFSKTWKEINTFLRSPSENPKQQEQKQSALSLMITAYLIFLVPILISSVFSILADHAGVINIDEHEVGQLMARFPKAFVLVLTVILVPFWEELLFRLPLRWQRAYIFRMLLFPIYLGRTTAFKTFQQRVESGWKRRYPIIFYAVASLFALIHLSNYPLTGPSWQFVLWAPLLVLPQLIIGVLLGFIRLRIGFWWSFLVHAMHNFIFMGIALLAPVNWEEYNTEEYNFAYREISSAPLNFTNHFSTDSVSFASIKLNVLYETYLFNQDSIKYIPNDSKGEQLIQLKFTLKNSNQDITILLEEALQKHIGLKVEKTWIKKPLLHLAIKDSIRLQSFQEIPKEIHRRRIMPDSIWFENESLSSILKEIQEAYPDENLDFKGEDSKYYSLQLPRLDFPDLIKHLEEEYGLTFLEQELKGYWRYSLN